MAEGLAMRRFTRLCRRSPALMAGAALLALTGLAWGAPLVGHAGAVA